MTTTPQSYDAPPTTLHQEAYLGLTRTQDALAAELGAFFKSHGLSQPLYNVLRIVRGAGPEGLPSQKICGQLITRVPDVTRLIDRLEKSGLVSRHRSELDRRVIRVRITPEGRLKLAELDPQVLEVHRRQLGHMSVERLALLNELLAEALLGAGSIRR